MTFWRIGHGGGGPPARPDDAAADAEDAWPLDGNIGIPCPWPCRDRRRPAPAQLRRLDAALSACGGCQPGSGGLRWSPLRPCRLSAARTIAAPSGCSQWHCRLDGDDAGLAFGQRAGSCRPEAYDPLQPLAGFGILDQHTRLRAASDRHHDGHWRCRAEHAGRQVGKKYCAILSPSAWSMPSAAAMPPSKGARRRTRWLC